MRTTARALTSRLLVAMVSAIIMGWSASASASSLLFAYSYTGDGIAGAGILTTTDTLVAGAYTITGIEGLLNADMPTLLAPGGYLGNDNSLLASAPFLDYAGLSVQAGGINHNIYNNGPCGANQNYDAPSPAVGCGAGIPISLRVTPFTPAAGSLYFAYTYTGNGIAGAGILTTTNTLVGGAYTITGIDGLLNADLLTLLAPGAYLGNDNSLFASAPFLDYAGLSVQAGGVNHNIYNNGPCGANQNYDAPSPAVGCGAGIPISLNVSPLSAQAVPEPASITLLGLGVVGLISHRWRRRPEKT